MKAKEVAMVIALAILASLLLINEISRDGEVNWLEGVQLIVLYVIMGVLFFFHP